MLEHGGDLRRAAQDYGVVEHEWLDLSTGISPWCWLDERPQSLSTRAWHRLPADDDGLDQAAHDYYGQSALPVAGSQAAIQALPRLRAPCRVAVLTPCYGEHAQAWRRAGHEVDAVTARDLFNATRTHEVIVLANPNNPDAQTFSPQILRAARARLALRGGWLVVDEAFVDAQAGLSLVDGVEHEGLIVLRSLGKFFGLAGARVGFVLAAESIRGRLREELGPWPLCGASRHLAIAALRDREWQSRQRLRLHAAACRLTAMLRDHGVAADGNCALFTWHRHPQSQAIHQQLARRGVLTRLHIEAGGLRVGLPGDDTQWRKLKHALASLRLNADIAA